MKKTMLFALAQLGYVCFATGAAQAQTVETEQPAERIVEPASADPSLPERGATAPAPENTAEGVKTSPPQPARSVPTEAVTPQTAAPRTEAFWPRIPIDFSGYFWVDSGYMKRENAQAGQYDQEVNYMQGRFVLTAAYRKEIGDYYGLARAQYIGFVNELTKSQYEAHTLDAFVKIGHAKYWDIQVGRFLAWEIYHRGQGIELFTAEEAGALSAPALYWLDLTRGYRNESGQAAFHLYPWEMLGIEIAAVYGQESNQNNIGARPAVDFRLGKLEILAGYEYLKQSPQTDADKVEQSSSGFAGQVRYTFPYVTWGISASHLNVDAIEIQGVEDTDKTLTKTSVGSFADIDFWQSSIGLGYHFTTQENKQNENNKHHQAFVTYLHRLPIQGLSAKAVFGYAKAHIEDTDNNTSWDNNLMSVRLRIAYEFN